MNTAIPLVMIVYVLVATLIKTATKDTISPWIVISIVSATLPLSMIALAQISKASALTGRVWAIASLLPAFITQLTFSWNAIGKSGTEIFLISVMVISGLAGSVVLIIEAVKSRKQLLVAIGAGVALFTLAAAALQKGELLYPIAIAAVLSPWALTDRQWKLLPPYLLMLFAYFGIGVEQDVKTYLNLSIVVAVYSIGSWLLSRHINKQIQKVQSES